MKQKTIDLEVPAAFLPLLDPYRYKAFFGGRGSAKSHSFARALLILAGAHRLRVLCAREIQKSIDLSVKQLLDDVIDEYGLHRLFKSTKSRIDTHTGGHFVFHGLQDHTADSVKSFEGYDICWIEEAQTISSRSLELLIPTIRKSKVLPQSEIWASWNPRNATDPIDMRFRGLTVPKNSLIKRVSWRDNPWFPAELAEERLFDKKNNPTRYGHIWEGDYEPLAIGAIWDRVILHQHRMAEVPDDIERVVVAVDPPASNHEESNEAGIVVVGLTSGNRCIVLEDASMAGNPRAWAERTVQAFDHWSADTIVYERNQGGQMVELTLRTVRPDLPTIDVWAAKGKHVRAEPVAALYHRGQVSHVGTFPELEDQMCKMTARGYEGEDSPDRCDALVWAITEIYPDLVEIQGNDPPPEEEDMMLRFRRGAHGTSWMAS